MAGFAEVMRHARRLCNTEECRKCPLYNFDTGDCMMLLDYNGETDVNYAEIENIITQWAKENPEPVYPSWAEAWERLFPDGDGIPCRAFFNKKYRIENCYCSDCIECNNKPMPAEIAKKLGIKPSEG